MPPFVPTVREIFLLGTLLVFLLTFPTTYNSPTASLREIAKLRSNPYGEEAENATPVTFESKYSLQSLNIPLVWGLGQVPKTDIVVHVPGAWLIHFLDDRCSHCLWCNAAEALTRIRAKLPVLVETPSCE